METVLSFLEPYQATEQAEWIVSPQMAQYTSFRIGGRADLLVYPKSAEALCSIVDFLAEHKIKHVVLGRMTNLLFTDEDYHGVVICTSKIKGISLDGLRATAECGVTLAELCRFLRDSSLTGHEFAYGIPGSIGGAVYMNAGAGEKSMSDLVTSVTYYDTVKRETYTVLGKDCSFAYRSSMFAQDPSKIVLRAEFLLAPGDRDVIAADMTARMEKRAASQPLEFPSAGSVFKRHSACIVSKLIDETGLKGLSVGDAEVSRKHAGFIINKGHATAKDVQALIAEVKAIIRQRHAIELEEEILFIE
ncbi:MAG: UDP-N-acetylmuramate dehydrogenase [Clostridia bacterium]|nr:UDP-N-acetylmuramate dehydrogenase [Clostridia bacterium]